MNNKIRFSNEHLVLADIMQHHTDLKNALRLYFSKDNKNLQARFSEYTNKKLLFQELSKRTEELDLSSVFSLFSAIEAAFRIDCLQRILKKKDDTLSRLFDKKYSKKKQDQIGIKEIFSDWEDYIKDHTKDPNAISLISNLKDAFDYRNWLAHGRYWRHQTRQKKYDYAYTYNIAETVFSSFPLEK